MVETAKCLQLLESSGRNNLAVLVQHRTAFNVACEYLAANKGSSQGLMLPVDFMESGIAQYHALQMQHKIPILIAGYEPIDILQSLLLLVRQVNLHSAELIEQYRHSFAKEENAQRQAILNSVFCNETALDQSPVFVNENYLQYTVILPTSPQVETFFQQPANDKSGIKVTSFDSLSAPIQ